MLFQRLKLMTGKRAADIASDNGVSRQYVNVLYSGSKGLKDERLAEMMVVSLDLVIAEQEYKLRELKKLRKKITEAAAGEGGK